MREGMSLGALLLVVACSSPASPSDAGSGGIDAVSSPDTGTDGGRPSGMGDDGGAPDEGLKSNGMITGGCSATPGEALGALFLVLGACRRRGARCIGASRARWRQHSG